MVYPGTSSPLARGRVERFQQGPSLVGNLVIRRRVDGESKRSPGFVFLARGDQFPSGFDVGANRPGIVRIENGPVEIDLDGPVPLLESAVGVAHLELCFRRQRFSGGQRFLQ